MLSDIAWGAEELHKSSCAYSSSGHVLKAQRQCGDALDLTLSRLFLPHSDLLALTAILHACCCFCPLMMNMLWIYMFAHIYSPC